MPDTRARHAVGRARDGRVRIRPDCGRCPGSRRVAPGSGRAVPCPERSMRGLSDGAAAIPRLRLRSADSGRRRWPRRPAKGGGPIRASARPYRTRTRRACRFFFRSGRRFLPAGFRSALVVSGIRGSFPLAGNRFPCSRAISARQEASLRLRVSAFLPSGRSPARGRIARRPKGNRIDPWPDRPPGARTLCRTVSTGENNGLWRYVRFLVRSRRRAACST